MCVFVCVCLCVSICVCLCVCVGVCVCVCFQTQSPKKTPNQKVRRDPGRMPDPRLSLRTSFFVSLFKFFSLQKSRLKLTHCQRNIHRTLMRVKTAKKRSNERTDCFQPIDYGSPKLVDVVPHKQLYRQIEIKTQKPLEMITNLFFWLVLPILQRTGVDVQRRTQ